MTRLLLCLAMPLGTAALASAQNAPAEPREVRQALTQADLANLAGRLILYENQQSTEAARLLRLGEQLAIERDPARAEELRKQLPPGIIEQAQKQYKLQSKNASSAVELPRSQHPAGKAWHAPLEKAPLQSYPPPLDPGLQNHPTVRTLLRLWEKNVGPLEKTPTLKKILADLLRNGVHHGEAGASAPFGDDAFNSLFNPESPAGREIAEMLEQAANGSSWKWADLGLDDWNFNMPQSQAYTAGSMGWTSPSADGESPPLLDLLLALAALAIAAVVLRRFSGMRAASAGLKITRPSDPPLDPNAIRDRESLVKAFEKMTLTAMGPEAAAWNHCTIAAELNRRVIVAGGTAAEAARLYELARYSHPSEPLPSESLARARHCLVLLGEAAAR